MERRGDINFVNYNLEEREIRCLLKKKSNYKLMRKKRQKWIRKKKYVPRLGLLIHCHSRCVLRRSHEH